MSATHEVAEDLCVVHTSHPILSAENLVDFQRFMGELDRAGRESHFWQMWGAVWEVCHLPVPDEVLTHLSLTVVARYPCAASFAWRPSADGATKEWVVSSSLSWDLGAGSWISGSVVMRLGGRLPLAGPSCPRSSGFSDPPASWSRTLFPRPSGELFSQPSLIAFATEQVPGSTKCSPLAAR